VTQLNKGLQPVVTAGASPAAAAGFSTSTACFRIYSVYINSYLYKMMLGQNTF